MQNWLSDMKEISEAVGSSPEFVQGGGGNTSVKINEELMVIKASGYELREVSALDGWVTVNFKKIKEFHKVAVHTSDEKIEYESTEFIKGSVVSIEGLKTLRPSIETGFHAHLKKYVIHTHSVYANILCCSVEGEKLLTEIFRTNFVKFLWIPFKKPGFDLTILIKNKLEDFNEKTGYFPEALFLENHGLIVTSDDKLTCLKLNDQINLTIKKYFKITESYPKIEVIKISEQLNEDNSPFLKKTLKSQKPDLKFFKQVLFPDQIVYFNENIKIGDHKAEKKITLNNLNLKIFYNCNKKEAVTISETLTAYFYLIEKIKNNGLTLKTISKKNIESIKNMESEKFRQNFLIKEGKVK